MNRFNIIYKVRVRVLLMAAILLVGCTADDDTAVQHDDTLQLAAYTRDYTDITTRADGYNPYQPENVTSIGIFMTPPDEGDPALEYFSYNGFKWQSNIGVKARKYYIYGFMPGDVIDKSKCSISPLSGDYANGAVLTLDGLKPISKTDVCVIVGVGETTDPSASTANNAQLGSFLYDGTGKGKGQHYVNLLMDHIYSCLQFRMKVTEQYAQVRTIKLKRMELKSSKISATKAVITLTANTTGANPIGDNISWATPTGETGMSMVLFESEEGNALSSTTELVLSGNIIPGCTDVLSLVTTYDVYDRKGNLVRKDCVATNKLPSSLVLSTLKAGERQPVALTVAPTYIYVLSDPDLDNPTVTF